ncbi:hypothetical protein [Actinoplanes sp. NPDC051411]|uniref:hypothetical protein n=1 Tax=Actinoplanes sp. NPDC051411 TaxID=3155522 RepID=UPI00343787F1
MAGAHDNDGNSPDDLPDLPEEWGVIVIPDDLSELTDEVEAVRAELRQTDRSDRWRRLFNRPGLRQLRQVSLALLRAPVLIISMAVLVTVASLFASAWPGPPRQPVVQRTNDDHSGSLPALDVVDDAGRPVSLRAKLPAVILVTEGCDCDRLVSATAAAAKDRPQVAIVVIAAALSGAASSRPTTGQNTPATQTTPLAQTDHPVQTLHNPPGSDVREQLKLGRPDGTAAALLVDSKGQIVKTITRTASADVIQPYLARI